MQYPMVARQRQKQVPPATRIESMESNKAYMDSSRKLG